jgi:hypothetical protein
LIQINAINPQCAIVVASAAEGDDAHHALTASWRAEHTREALATQIVASARLGERDIDRLCDDALAHVQDLVVEPRKASPESLRDSGI